MRFHQCACGGHIYELDRTCNRCGISDISLIMIIDNFKNGKNEKIMQRWKREGLRPTLEELNPLPPEIFDWV